MAEREPAMPEEKGSDALAKTSGQAEQSAREAYHGGAKPPQGAGRELGRKDPQQSGDSEDRRENVRQR